MKRRKHFYNKETPALRKDERNAEMTDAVQDEFVNFIRYHNARQFSTNLRRMLLRFLRCERASDAMYMRELIYDLDGLFDLLDIIDAEVKSGDY